MSGVPSLDSLVCGFEKPVSATREPRRTRSREGPGTTVRCVLFDNAEHPDGARVTGPRNLAPREARGVDLIDGAQWRGRSRHRAYAGQTSTGWKRATRPTLVRTSTTIGPSAGLSTTQLTVSTIIP